MIKTAAATVSINALYILYMFLLCPQNRSVRHRSDPRSVFIQPMLQFRPFRLAYVPHPAIESGPLPDLVVIGNILDVSGEDFIFLPDRTVASDFAGQPSVYDTCPQLIRGRRVILNLQIQPSLADGGIGSRWSSVRRCGKVLHPMRVALRDDQRRVEKAPEQIVRQLA